MTQRYDPAANLCEWDPARGMPATIHNGTHNGCGREAAVIVGRRDPLLMCLACARKSDNPHKMSYARYETERQAPQVSIGRHKPRLTPQQISKIQYSNASLCAAFVLAIPKNGDTQNAQ